MYCCKDQPGAWHCLPAYSAAACVCQRPPSVGGALAPNCQYAAQNCAVMTEHMLHTCEFCPLSDCLVLEAPLLAPGASCVRTLEAVGPACCGRLCIWLKLWTADSLALQTICLPPLARLLMHAATTSLSASPLCSGAQPVMCGAASPSTWRPQCCMPAPREWWRCGCAPTGSAAFRQHTLTGEQAAAGVHTRMNAQFPARQQC